MNTTALAQALGDVSGTAFLVAHCRALESLRAAPLFEDPWAAQLAGERGRVIVERLPVARQNVWAFATRTAILDRLIAEQIAQENFGVVINLAAGLDTRAFRLALPSSLRWYDVDAPNIIEHKRRVLQGVQPRCGYEALSADLTDLTARRQLFNALGAKAEKVLVITEGLLHYLTEPQVSELASDLAAVPSLHTWLIDLNSRATFQHLQRTWNKALGPLGVTVHFGPVEGSKFFAPFGWREVEAVSLFTEGVRLKRVPVALRIAMATLGLVAPRLYAQIVTSGIVRMQRDS